MKRFVWWALVITAMVLYGIVVYSWWQEGNRNFEKQRQEQQHESL